MMLGHLMEWFFSGPGGIRQVPGSSSYSKVIICPELVGDLKWAETTYKTIHGDITCNWKKEKDDIFMNIKIPVNCSANVSIPQTNPDKIFENGILIKQSKLVRIIGVSSGRLQCEVPSGEYNFRTTLNN
jgi:hypothetical protein